MSDSSGVNGRGRKEKVMFDSSGVNGRGRNGPKRNHVRGVTGRKIILQNSFFSTERQDAKSGQNTDPNLLALITSYFVWQTHENF